jgi:hypothetical protein
MENAESVTGIRGLGVYLLHFHCMMLLHLMKHIYALLGISAWHMVSDRRLITLGSLLA